MREHNIIERTQYSLTSLTKLKIDSLTNRGTSEGPETSEQEYSTSKSDSAWFSDVRQYLKSYFEKRCQKMTFTKLDQEDLDSPRRELSNGGLGIVVAPAFSGIVFLYACGVQSSYSQGMEQHDN